VYRNGLKGCDWLWELMIVSQITASDGGTADEPLREGYVAVIQTNNCFVFQLNSDVKSVRCQLRPCSIASSSKEDKPASRSNFI